MADNSQNTAVGGAGNLIPMTGNNFLDNIFGWANVGVVGAANIWDTYESVLDRKAAREIALLNASKAPNQSLPANQADSPADYLSDPARAQKLFMTLGIFSLLGVGIWYGLKKS